ncbi:MAG: hypothetical protein KF914_15580, partial [Rhizobiaceae bacterium]|nr:hypothetical protein [Rhizobiaceae bacterium]
RSRPAAFSKSFSAKQAPPPAFVNSLPGRPRRGFAAAFGRIAERLCRGRITAAPRQGGANAARARRGRIALNNRGVAA